ncbi:MAG: pyrimidine 5'-nucleotidase [Cohaesibacter sp.]|jgi:putative hydrolase of the HAD superfamily|nr:pyrimidine 5'-nucleotidase [Cohaesibacter sp.]
MVAQTDTDYDFSAFGDIDVWIFDLDNTLYPPSTNLFKQMNEKMSDYVARLLNISESEATNLREGYYKEHGTTLRGLMIEHDIHPDDFLEYVHNIDHSWVKPDPALARAICALPGKRYIFTNGTNKHALAVAERLGITDYFDDIFDIVWADLDPKPNKAPYDKLLSETGLNPKKAAMFEDLARNLKVPHSLGMQTVLMVPSHTQAVFEGSWQAKGAEAPHVNFVSDDLAGFLTDMLVATGHEERLNHCAIC